MRRLTLVVLAFTACMDAPTEPAARAETDLAMALSIGAPCVYFTKDRREINGSLDCEENAFGIEVSFGGGPATIRLVGADIRTPHGITGFRMTFKPGPGGGQLTGLQWKQGTRTIDQDVLPSRAVGLESFDVFAKTFTDVRWIGGGRIDIPAGANDLHYLLLGKGV